MPRMLVSHLTQNNINAAMVANERGLEQMSTFTDAAAANGVFFVDHDLGAIPDDFRVSPYGNVVVWATRDDRAAWTDAVLVLHGSAAVDVAVAAVKRL